MADIDLQATDASQEFADGAIFERVTPENAGTGLFDPFLTVQDQEVENGYNTNELGQLDNVYSSGGEGGRTEAILLSSIPIRIIDGVAYYEFRLDMNEPNSDPVCSIERLEIYSSTAQGDSSTFQGAGAADAFVAADGFTKVFDLDANGDNRLIISDVTSSGSGRDDYRLLIPVENFDNADPTTTYLTMYVELGMTDSDLDVAATFEEWRTEVTATVNGLKFVDVDRDGVFDASEDGMGGVTVFIDEDRDGVFDVGERSAVTAADGTFRFLGVTTDWDDGDVWIDEVVPNGYEQTTGAHEVAEVIGGGASYVEIGNAPLFGSISGTKYEDTDNDGDGDVALAGWTINLYEDEDGDGQIDADDDLLDTTVTDANGDYSFADLTPGDYIVEEEMQSGWQAVSAAVAGAEVTSSNDTAVDFVNEELGSIAGTKYEDTDNDGDGDVGLAGWTINLYEDEDGDGQIDADDDLLDTTVTDANGDYSFTGLAPGDYIVEEEMQSGWQAVSATVHGGTLTSGGGLDFDFVNEQLGSISGTKYEDTDNDDDGDVGLAGWTIELYEDDDGDGQIDAGDALLDAAVTDANGDYSFTGLAPGDYIVKEQMQSGWQAVSAEVVGDTLTSGGALDIDFVNEELGSISGTKWADLDHDGVRDAGDNGLQGWTIALFLDDGDGFLDAGDTLVDTTQTDANGDYEFTVVAPGDYIIVEEVQNGWVQTAPNAADADPESGDVNGGGLGYSEFGYLVDLSSGEDNGDNDFGNFLLPGPGVRTPGFWGSPNGLKFWDGIAGNETKSGPDFPSGELAPGGFLILGDDGDHVVETGELKITVADAQKIINASSKDGSGPAFMLARDVIAATLNGLAGNPLGDVSDTSSPAYYLEEGVDWLIKYLNGGQSGANTLTLAEVKSSSIKTTSAAWKVGASDDGIESGASIHSALDQYNNDGSISGLAFAQDGDNGFSIFEQQYQTMLSQHSTYFI